MKVPLLSLTREKIKEKELPMQFEEEIRPDLIKRAVLAIQSGRRQPYGASPEAGKRSSATISKRRHSYKTSYGHGISRVPRKILSRRGSRFNWVGAFAPGTVGGRRAHPPKAGKVWLQKINKKEKRKAIRSAIAATMADDIVKKNYITPEGYPFIIDTKIEMISKTKEAISVLGKLGLKEEIEAVEVPSSGEGSGLGAAVRESLSGFGGFTEHELLLVLAVGGAVVFVGILTMLLLRLK